MNIKKIKILNEKTGCGLINCKNALEYSNGDYSIAMAYLRAIIFAYATPKLSLDERVDHFNRAEDIDGEK